MRFLVLSLFFVFANGSFAQIDFPQELTGRNLGFIPHTGPNRFDNALALNVELKPIDFLRKEIEGVLDRELEIFRGWNSRGEAHVTVITPPEYANVLGKFLKMSEINEIALANRIQESDINILGVGTGRKLIDGVEEETYFVIVDSRRLRDIRFKIWQAYVSKGGDARDWDPTWFFPHVTIGFTKQDIHEPDVFKNIKYSYDSRFTLNLKKVVN